MRKSWFLKYQAIRLKSPSGQIATLFIILLAAIFIFIAVTINIGQVAKNKTLASNAADGAALAIGSTLSSVSRAIVDKLNGHEKDCDVDIWNIVEYITSIVLIILGEPSGFISLISSMYDNTGPESSQFKKWASKLVNFSETSQISEQAIQYGMFAIATDPNMSTDSYDSDEDGLNTDKVTDVSLWYDYHLDNELPDNLPVYLNAKTALVNWIGCKILTGGAGLIPRTWTWTSGLIPSFVFDPMGGLMETDTSLVGFIRWLPKVEPDIDLSAERYPGFKQTLVILSDSNFPLTNPGWQAGARAKIGTFYKRGDPFDDVRDCGRLCRLCGVSCEILIDRVLRDATVDSVDITQWSLEELKDIFLGLAKLIKEGEDIEECADKIWPKFEYVRNIALAGDVESEDDMYIEPIISRLLFREFRDGKVTLDYWYDTLASLKASLVTDLTPYQNLCHGNCDEPCQTTADTKCKTEAYNNCWRICRNKADAFCRPRAEDTCKDRCSIHMTGALAIECAVGIAQSGWPGPNCCGDPPGSAIPDVICIFETVDEARAGIVKPCWLDCQNAAAGVCPEGVSACVSRLDSICYGNGGPGWGWGCFGVEYNRCYTPRFNNCIASDADYLTCYNNKYNECYPREYQTCYDTCFENCIAPYRAEIDRQKFLSQIIDRAMSNINVFRANVTDFYNASYADTGIWGINGPMQAYVDYQEELRYTNTPYVAKYGWKDSQGWHFARVKVGRFIVPDVEGETHWFGIEKCSKIVNARGSVRVEVTRYDQSKEVTFAGGLGNRLWNFVTSLPRPGVPPRKDLEAILESSLSGANDWRGINSAHSDYLSPIVSNTVVDQLLDYYGTSSRSVVNFGYNMTDLYLKGR
ncbi:MAG: Tad domain-containing protein [Candidatus Omnitrophota bacterium]